MDDNRRLWRWAGYVVGPVLAAILIVLVVIAVDHDWKADAWSALGTWATAAVALVVRPVSTYVGRWSRRRLGRTQTRRNPSGISSGRGRCQAVISGRLTACVLTGRATSPVRNHARAAAGPIDAHGCGMSGGARCRPGPRPGGPGRHLQRDLLPGARATGSTAPAPFGRPLSAGTAGCRARRRG